MGGTASSFGASTGGFAQFDGGGWDGGIMVKNDGPAGQPGSSTPAPCDICATRGQVGQGGNGYGAGGGGAANGNIAVGGDGAAGVVYVEW